MTGEIYFCILLAILLVLPKIAIMITSIEANLVLHSLNKEDMEEAKQLIIKLWDLPEYTQVMDQDIRQEMEIVAAALRLCRIQSADDAVLIGTRTDKDSPEVFRLDENSILNSRIEIE